MRVIVISLILIMLLIACTAADSGKSSTVYFTSDISAEGIMKVFEQVGADVEGKVGIKVHFGEEGNQNFIDPELLRALVEKLEASFIETNVLYRGKRRITETHIQLAKEHGFGYAPIDILDSEGEKEIAVSGKHFKKVTVGSHLDNYDNLVIVSHFKGHGLAGFGGAIKNVAMGMAAIPGKMAMHASSVPDYSPASCISCGACLNECPVNAITLNPLVIDLDKCIGCGKCIGTCPTYTMRVPWGGTDKNVFNERLVEYAKGISDNYKMVYINLLVNISKDCDCSGRAAAPFMEDIGILASTDIVAIEKACLDLINEAHDHETTEVRKLNGGKDQIEYAQKLGMGNLNYKFIDLDKEK
ncbi:MAG: DUF362 domain-containing protein [Candidatus Cloacimonetes bacterium]|nr:DUF362 domain-containing protein [Candidatus Cloacimonadota bacterium]